jgi:hypothetical protein
MKIQHTPSLYRTIVVFPVGASSYMSAFCRTNSWANHIQDVHLKYLPVLNQCPLPSETDSELSLLSYRNIIQLKLSHYTPRRRLGGEEVYLLHILDLGTRWGWVVSVTPRPRFSPGERTPGTHCTGGWVGPRAGLDTEVRGKILCLYHGSNPDLPVVQPVSRHYWLSYPAHI